MRDATGAPSTTGWSRCATGARHRDLAGARARQPGGSARRPRRWRSAEDVYQRLRDAGDAEQAADCALRLALAWGTRGDIQVAAAWLNRADRLLARPAARAGARHRPLPRRRRSRWTSRASRGRRRRPRPLSATSRRAHARRRRSSCFALVLDGHGRRPPRARPRTASPRSTRRCCRCSPGRVEALWAGDIYCTTIHLCEGLADLARMRDWTEALARWASPLCRTRSCTPASPASTSCS